MYEWKEVPEELKSLLPAGTFNLFMKITPVNHGPVIDVKTLGLKPGRTTEQSRRYSVMLVTEAGLTLQVGSISYYTGYDSFDPNEPFNKYLNNEFEVLLSVTAPFDYVWDGMAQSLVS